MRIHFILLIAALAAGAAAAAEHPSFAGTWMLDRAASTGDTPSWSAMTIAENGRWFDVEQNDQEGHIIRNTQGECKTDGRFHPVEGAQAGSIKCKWDGSAMTADEHWNDGRNTRSVRTTLLADGMLVQDIHETGPDGMKDAHLVWKRQ